MPALRIYKDGEVWIAVVSDTEIRYTFKGDNIVNQEDAISMLANYIKRNERQNIADCFADADELLIPRLFENTNALIFKDSARWTSLGDDNLLDDFGEDGVGRALEEAIIDLGFL